MTTTLPSVPSTAHSVLICTSAAVIGPFLSARPSADFSSVSSAGCPGEIAHRDQNRASRWTSAHADPAAPGYGNGSGGGGSVGPLEGGWVVDVVLVLVVVLDDVVLLLVGLELPLELDAGWLVGGGCPEDDAPSDDAGAALAGDAVGGPAASWVPAPGSLAGGVPSGGAG